MESFLSWVSKARSEWCSELVRDPAMAIIAAFGTMAMLYAIGFVASIPFMVYSAWVSPEEMYEYYKVLNDAPGVAGEAYREDLREWMRHASLDEQVEFLRLTSEGQE